MADPFQPQLQGRRLQLSARTFNGLQKAGQDYSRRKLDANQAPSSPAVPAPVQIFNALDFALEPFSVVQTDSASSPVNPAAVPLEAAAAPLFNAIAPAEDGRPIFITREAIPVGGIGEVVTSGPAVVWLDVTDAAHAFATPSAGIVDCLVSSASKGVPILWKESGTGLKLAQVMLGGSAGIDFTVETNSSYLADIGTPPTLVTSLGTPSFTETRRVQGLYFLQYHLSGTGPATVVAGLGAWPASYGTAAAAKAAGALKVLGPANWRTNDTGIWATSLPCLATTGNSFDDALYPIHLEQVALVFSGTIGEAFPRAFVRIPAGFNN